MIPALTSTMTLRLDLTPIFYLEILLSLVFLVSVVLIGVNLKAQPSLSNNLIEHERFNSIELKNFKPSDILKVYTNSKCAIVVSFELNHTITAWSPMDKRKHILAKDLWPINHIAISDDGIYIILVSFSKQTIYCFENYKLKWTKSDLNMNRESKVLESFFREKTVPGYLTRKMMKRNSTASLSSMSSHFNGNFPPPPPNPFVQRLDQTAASDPTAYEDFVLILQDDIVIFSCHSGNVKSEQCGYLTAAAKVKTPRVNDKIVLRDQNGDLTVGVAVNNKFVYRKLPIRNSYMGGGTTSAHPLAGTLHDLNPSVIIPLDFIGMIVLVHDLTASLVDIGTGILVKSFNIGHFKAGTFRVAHSEPTHCKFCGCVSVNSFSLVYQDDTNMLIVHTFKIDNQRSKNSICLRVERDVREIRCLGFNHVLESQYWYEDIKTWQVTDVNTIIGLERFTSVPTEPVTGSTTRRKTQCSSAYGLTSLRQRNNKKQTQQKDSYEGFIISLVDGDKETYPITVDLKILSSTKYGFKSILVNFGDSMKIFYQGTNKLIENDLYYNNSTNNKGNSLLFINKRRNRVN